MGPAGGHTVLDRTAAGTTRRGLTPPTLRGMADDGYSGPATLVVAGAEIQVTVTMRGHFEPIDGLYHWYGRINASERLAELLRQHPGTVRVRTPDGEASGSLSDPDAWGRYRVTGTSRPPFPVVTTLEEIECH